ncbi:hypothetical protein GCM10010246_77270 [Streptomyces cuspidosporus]|uniref:DUF4158 domain-containing protein n=1 Tax=Streptomyces cuspidosporus TaxID=66882 RepID=A0ABN3H7H3_9ACTN
MPVEFLSGQQAARYAAFNGVPSRAELERYLLLDDPDLEKEQAKRRNQASPSHGGELPHSGRAARPMRMSAISVASAKATTNRA